MRLIFANRTPADVLLKDELDALAVRFPNFKVRPRGVRAACAPPAPALPPPPPPAQVLYTVDSVPEGGAPWAGLQGHVTRDMIAAFLPPPQPEAGRHKLLVCGPPPMVAAVRRAGAGGEPRTQHAPCPAPPRPCRSVGARRAPPIRGPSRARWVTWATRLTRSSSTNLWRRLPVLSQCICPWHPLNTNTVNSRQLRGAVALAQNGSSELGIFTITNPPPHGCRTHLSWAYKGRYL